MRLFERTKRPRILGLFYLPINTKLTNNTKSTGTNMKFSEFLAEQFAFDEKKELNQKLWAGNKMRPEVRKALMRIAKSFIKYVNSKEMVVVDIVVTGSLANYTWHDKSDVDLHIIVDTSKIEDLPTMTEFFSAKKSLWNSEHTIECEGFPLELYIQSSDEEHNSSGVYSILRNEWDIQPKKSNPVINDGYVEKKAKMWKERIDHIIKHKVTNLSTIDALKKRLRDSRKSGLAKDGEFSVENLAFKILRTSGYINKLYDYALKLEDDELSLK